MVASARTVRLGLVGTENTHAEHFLRSFNVERRHPGVRVHALCGSGSARDSTLRDLGGVAHLVPTPDDLIDLIDGVLVCSRDGREHLREARPFLERGIPVFVDKPLALSTADAAELVRIAASAGAPLTSFSGIRVHSRIASLAASAAAGPLERLAFSGPADPHGPHGGLAFYGTHLVEGALSVVGETEVAVQGVERRSGRIIAHAMVGPTELELDFISDADQRWVLSATAAGVTSTVDVVMTAEEIERGSAAVARFFTTNVSPLSAAELLAPVAMMEQISLALDMVQEVRP